MTKTCPNCGSRNVAILPGGRLLPFFVKRVFGIEPPTLGTLLPARISPMFRMLGRWPRPLDCDILICSECDFVCPGIDIPESQLLNLYQDYRCTSYNAERIRYEPSYGKIANLIGKSPEERQSRLAHVEKFLADVPGAGSIRDVLDFAGADGRFIPPRLLQQCNCTICDVSEEQPWFPGIRKTKDLAQLGLFDYIQMCHVLEHVREPKALLASVAAHISANGLVYIEVPRETTSQQIDRLRAAKAKFPIHEHINLYTEKSLRGLLESTGLALLKIADAELDLGWCRASVLSAVATPSRS